MPASVPPGSSGSWWRQYSFCVSPARRGCSPECFLVFLFDLQTLLLPILTIVLVQAYAIADEVLVGTGGSYDDTVDIADNSVGCSGCLHWGACCLSW